MTEIEQLTAQALAKLSRRKRRKRSKSQVESMLRPLGFIVSRESDEHDREMFNSMRELTYQNLRDIPAVEAVRREGMTPMRGGSFFVDWEVDGQVQRREVLVTELRLGMTRARLFYFEGYWHLWSMASAAKTSEDGFNEFTTMLIDEIEELRPRVLYAANLSRLIRSQFEEKRLSLGLCDNVDKIVAKDMTIRLTGPDSAFGFMQLTMMGFCAATERDAIVQRLLAGKIAKWRRNEWPFGSAVIPFGYRFDKELSTLVPMPELRPQVAEMLLVLASDVPVSEKARRLDEIGVPTLRSSRKTGDTRFSTRSNIESAVRSLYAWIPVWVSGEFLFRYQNPLDDLEELSGLPVVRYPAKKGGDDSSDPGELQMLYRVGVPDGGWADPSILAAVTHKATHLAGIHPDKPRPVADASLVESEAKAIHQQVLPPEFTRGTNLANRSRRNRARARRLISPFTGRHWIRDDHFYEMRSTNDGYTVTRWPLDSLDPAIDIEYADYLANRKEES
ncbi:hypothetical protein [Aeromicrobium sp. WCS2018Hpa-31]|nr:hypothetical protein [Aeromicrobium sp. WCS2018Hpa-31]